MSESSSHDEKKQVKYKIKRKPAPTFIEVCSGYNY